MMISRVTASAPGKVVLSGEYAVLSGAPAICMAVNRRATVTIEQTSNEFHVVEAPGHVSEPRRFLARAGVFGWIDSSDEFELLERVWARSGIDQHAGLSLRLDTTDFLDPVRGCKTGIGSSAALSVALACALDEWSKGSGDPEAVAHEGHLDFQGRLGSGVDIASSNAGGIVRYVMEGRSASRLAMPAGLECRLFWSGTPASTGIKIERFSSHGPKPSKAALTVSARRVAKAWAGGSADEVLARTRNYIQVLQEFDADHELGIFDAGHAEMTAAAADAGLIYKPCGAGGGDIGILLADNAAHADEFIDAGLPGEFQALDLHYEEQGAEVTREDQ
jgi:phosphomevalonate kinase